MVSDHRRFTLGRLALSALTGILLGLSFPPSTLGILACFGLVPLLFVVRSLGRLRSFLGYSYLAFLVFHVITLNWTGGYSHGNDPYMMIAGAVTMLVHPLFYWLPMGVYFFLRKHLGSQSALWAFPFVWVAYEFSHTMSQWSFPWLTLGNSQTYDLAKIQIVSLTGVIGISFWILLINVLTFQLIQQLLTQRRKIFSRDLLLTLAAIVVLYVLPSVHGTWVLDRGAPPTDAPRDSIAIGMIQSNIDPWDKWKGGYSTVDLYVTLTSRLMDSAGSHRPQIVIWPETAFPFDLLAEPNRIILDDLRHRLVKWESALITGLPHRIWYGDSLSAPINARREKGTNRRYDWFNSAAFIQPGDTIVPWYGKMKMVPFAERIPYAEVFQFVDFLRWDVGIGGWQLGTDTTVFRHAATGSRFSTVICYESTYPDFLAGFVRKGAEFITIITVDSWWGRMSGAYQHQQYAILRAIENRRWVARCAVGGISCFIDPFGRVYDATELFTQRSLMRSISRETELSFYSQHGDWVGVFALVVTALFFSAGLGQKFFGHMRRKL